MSAVKDQGGCGACWAFAATATIESYVALQSGLLFDLSVQQMAMCAPNTQHCGGTGGCQGSTAELAFEYVSGSNGIYQEFQYGYTSYEGNNSACLAPRALMERAVAGIRGYVRLPNNNYSALLNAVARVGPVAINVDATTWSAYSSGVFAGCSRKELDINHVVVLAGYGEDAQTAQPYWLVRNSWSAGWGEQGYVRVARSDQDDRHCAVDPSPQDGVACEGEGAPVSVCGTCGVIYDAAYPLNAEAL